MTMAAAGLASYDVGHMLWQTKSRETVRDDVFEAGESTKINIKQFFFYSTAIYFRIWQALLSCSTR